MKKTSEQYRIEYNKMVDDIKNKLKAIEKIDRDSVSLDRYRKYFRKVNTKNPNLNKIKQMHKKAKEVIKSGELSVEGHKRSVANMIRTFTNEGYTFVNKKNVNEFLRFLDDARSRGLGALYSSTQLMETWEEVKRNKLSKKDIKKNMEYWANQVKTDKEGKIIEVVKPKGLKVKR